MEKVIVDCSTGQTTIVPLTPEEIAQAEAAAAEAEVERAVAEAEAAAKAQAKADLLDRLGITEEEAKLLIG